MAIRAYFWGLVLLALSIVQGQAAQCPAFQIDRASQFAANPTPGDRARLICDQQFVRVADRAAGETGQAACLSVAETAFTTAYDDTVATGTDCNLTRPGTEVGRVWGSEIDQPVAPLLSAWAQPASTGTGFSAASRDRRFASLIRAIGYAMNQAFRAEAGFIRNELNAGTLANNRANATRKLTRRLVNLTRNRRDYNGPTAEALVNLTNQSIDRIVAMALATPGIPAPTSVNIQDGGNGVDLGEATAGVPVTVGLADDLWLGVQLNLSWGNQPPITVGLTAGDLAARTISLTVPFATISAQGSGPVTVSARLSHPAGATSLTLTAGTTVTLSVPLSVRVSGLGTVTSTPAGIECGSNTTCSASFPPNTQVTLQAVPQNGWGFAGWAGDCSGTGGCTVTLDQSRSVIANFTQLPIALNVAVSGLGDVTSFPAGAECGPNTGCTASFPAGTTVTLQAAPRSGWVFAGWAGDCSGTGGCTVTLDQSRSVTANFTQLPIRLNVAVSGLGDVTSSPAGAGCGANASCTASFPAGTTVILQAVPRSGWVFTGWAGDCSGTGGCTVTLDQPRSVTANFAPIETGPSPIG